MTVRKVLLVEDEILVAMLVEDMLVELGFDVIGPATRLNRALEFARTANVDLAVLDVNLANERSYPIAQVLKQRGIPFIFATGYGETGLTEEFRGAVTIQKPFKSAQLAGAISAILPSR